MSGVISLKARTKIYAYVGGSGVIIQSSHDGGFNGGGSSHTNKGASSGGASDIRIEADDVLHRVIVAGGG